MDKKEYKISEEFVGLRLDKAISMKDSSLSRVAVQRMIDEENILVNNKKTKTSYKLKLDDVRTLLDFWFNNFNNLKPNTMMLGNFDKEN